MELNEFSIKPIRVCKKSGKPFKDGKKVNTLIRLGYNSFNPNIKIAGVLLESNTTVGLNLLKKVNDRTYYAISSSENLEDFGDIFYGNIEHFQDCFCYTEEDTLENITFLSGEIFKDTLIFVTEVK